MSTSFLYFVEDSYSRKISHLGRREHAIRGGSPALREVGRTACRGFLLKLKIGALVIAHTILVFLIILIVSLTPKVGFRLGWLEGYPKPETLFNRVSSHTCYHSRCYKGDKSEFKLSRLQVWVLNP